MNEGRYFVYALCDPRKDFMPFYIGKGTIHEQHGIFARTFEHMNKAKNGKKSHLSNKIKQIIKSGAGIALEILSWWEAEEDAYAEEKRITDEIGLENLTNSRTGGMGGNRASSELRKKLSLAAKGRIPWNKGKRNHCSEETIKKMSESHKGKPSPKLGCKLSKETRKKISKAQLNISEETRKRKSDAQKLVWQSEEYRKKQSEVLKGNQYFLGHKHTEESKQKMSKAHLNMSDETKRKIGLASKKSWLENKKVWLEKRRAA